MHTCLILRTKYTIFLRAVDHYHSPGSSFIISYVKKVTLLGVRLIANQDSFMGRKISAYVIMRCRQSY